MQDAIILGGGISGLTAAYLMQQKGLEVSVIEKAPTPGGPINSYQKDGFIVEKGPNSLLLPDQWVESFISELGLGTQLLENNPAASKRFIVRKGKPIAVPASPLQAISTPLFSFRGKLNALFEPFRKQISNRNGANESVASFVRRRLGQDFLDYAIDPLVSGIYAGNPQQLILEHAFPLMRGFERDGGSIIRGALQYKKRRKKDGTNYRKRSVSFASGLGALPQTIAKKLGNRLWLGAEVVAVNRLENEWQVTWKKDGENFEGFAKSLVVCLPSHAIKKIAWSSTIAEPIRSTPDLPYPCVHSLAIGFRTEQVKHALDGFGMLIPSKEPYSILGALFSSSLYSNRAPEGHHLLTVMMGGTRRPELAHESESNLKALALQDLRQLLGIEGEPCFFERTTWQRAIPQYTKDYGPWRDTLKAIEDQFPGLYFGGNSVDGIAMGASILSGKRLSEAVGKSHS